MAIKRMFASVAVFGLVAVAAPMASAQQAPAPQPPSPARLHQPDAYEMPIETVRPGYNEATAPELPVGTLAQPARVRVETLSVEEETVSGKNLLRVRIPRGHRLHVGGIAVPELHAGTPQFEGFSFAPKLWKADSGTTCRTTNFIDTTNSVSIEQPTTLALISSDYRGGEASCYDTDLFLDLGLQREKFDKAINVDTFAALVPEPVHLGDSFNEQPSDKRGEDAVGEPPRDRQERQLAPGAFPQDAPELIGVTEAQIVEGETQFFAVPVLPGQSLKGSIEIIADGDSDGDGDGDGNQEPVDPFLRGLNVWVVNQLGQSHSIVGQTEAKVAQAKEPRTFASEYAISYGNLQSTETRQRLAWLGGTHYVAVSFTNFIDAATSTNAADAPAADTSATTETPLPPVTYRITLEPIGRAAQGPDFRAAAGTGDHTATDDSAPAGNRSERSRFWLLLAAIGGTALVVLIGVLSVMFKNARK
ncbi:hypothetical protein [Corynebacterium sp.]|uniref:hypothetical protein n=1 Tax=Corynebacterium sp. TaxID=1720 RepID=UPI0026DD54AE|nr:hypothetical protein [Corynebacterium sp.]MDO5076015.1 hypothetical protein [Corynebacterium sp.]